MEIAVKKFGPTLIILSALVGCEKVSSNTTEPTSEKHLSQSQALEAQVPKEIPHGSDAFKKAYLMSPIFAFHQDDKKCTKLSSIPAYHSNFVENTFATTDDFSVFVVVYPDDRGYFFYANSERACQTAIKNDRLFIENQEQSRTLVQKALQPLFAAGRDCFKSCAGHPAGASQPDTSRVLPREFKDFLATTDYGLDKLVALVSTWPENYKPLVIKAPNERDTMEMEGFTSYVMNFQGDPIQIYVQSGFPKREWTPGPYRRPPGGLTVAVNPRTRAMAAIFNGQEDLSEYRFAGDEKLLSLLVAYTVASEAETEKAHLISRTQQSEGIVFPIPTERIARVEARLAYLSGLYLNGQIRGARSAYAAGNDARKVPPEKQWWAANSSFTECLETGGPAAKLDEFVGFIDKPHTQDYRNSSGKLVKVEVINAIGGGRETVWTYYKEKSQCEAEQVNATKSLADRYR